MFHKGAALMPSQCGKTSKGAGICTPEPGATVVLLVGFEDLGKFLELFQSGKHRSSCMTERVHGFDWQEFLVAPHRALVSRDAIENIDGLPNDFAFNGGCV